MDKELIEELEKRKSRDSEVLFEEHSFIASALKIGLTIQDLKELEFVDVAKIMLCYLDTQRETKRATQADWDKLAGRR